MDHSTNGRLYERLSVWHPWDGLREFHLSALTVDIIVAISIIFLAGTATQLWRSRHRSFWQWGFIDLLGMVILLGLAWLWRDNQSLECQREEALIAAFGRRNPYDDHHSNYVQKDAVVPGFLPDWMAIRYRNLFERVMFVQTYRDTDIACQFPNVSMLKTWVADANFVDYARRMPQLEALIVDDAILDHNSSHIDSTSVRDLPGLAKLRAVSFRQTPLKDADLEWLGRCPCLEVVDLSFTDIGDEGLRHLAALRKLRVLAVAGNRITNDGCRAIARLKSLEDLTLSSNQVQDAGSLELMHLTKLRKLALDTASSSSAIDKMRQRLPLCEILATKQSPAVSGFDPFAPDPFAPPM